MRYTVLAAILLSGALLAPYSLAEGEAGLLVLRGQGHFYTGLEVSEPAENGAVKVMNQTYVGFQLPAERKHPYPIVLVHGGGAQSTEWFSTPDGRAGWRDYFLAAGYDVYWVDRPGFGRAPTNAHYGELRGSANSQIITFLANSTLWPGNPKNPTDPTILAQLASTPPGPYAGHRAAAKGISELLDRIGPAILLTHSAGALAGWWAADLNPGKVAGIIAIEPGASNVTTRMREGLSFTPPLEEGFTPVKDADDCELQGAGSSSKLPHFPTVHLVGSEHGLTGGLECAEKAFAQAGVKVKYTYLPDIGFTGNGHYMMAELNNGDLARVMMQLAENIALERGKSAEKSRDKSP
jgi:pimeloyl-ACP methyl ester carboxylesterase